MKVSIIYGWSEGKWHSKQLRKRLEASNFTVVNDHKSADIIIAHSGGCFLVPKATSAKYILLIGLPLWENKFIFKSLFEKIKLETKDWWWYKKTFYHVVYLLAKISHWLRMHRSWRRKTLPENSASSIFLLRNNDDAFVNAEESQALAKEKGWQYIDVYGQHDDIWVNPKQYTDLLESILTARL